MNILLIPVVFTSAMACAIVNTGESALPLFESFPNLET